MKIFLKLFGHTPVFQHFAVPTKSEICLCSGQFSPDIYYSGPELLDYTEFPGETVLMLASVNQTRGCKYAFCSFFFVSRNFVKLNGQCCTKDSKAACIHLLTNIDLCMH